MTTTPSPEAASGLLPTVQEYMDRDYARQFDRLAAHLRRYADRIEQLGKRSAYDRDGRAVHVVRVSDVLGELRAMDGNMTMLDQLVVAAGDAQREADKTREAQS